jgi:hypothetical protein
MNVKKPNGLVNGQVGRKMFTDMLPKVDNVLADNVVNQHYSLLRVNPGGLQRLKESEVDILLLFSLKQVHQCIGCITSMPCTRNGHYTSPITCL